jgi:type I restriction enzyme M protein
MPSKRDVLGQLSRDELVAAANQFDLAVADRRVKEQLVDTVAASKKAGLADVLEALPRDRLKELSSVITSKPATNDHFKTGHHGVTETVFV